MAINVLVLCTGNSARSILGEVLVNALGGDRFRGFSAGSHPVGKVNPGAIRKLHEAGHSLKGLESKSWDRFSGPDAPRIDIVVTVCDNAAGEACPIWNGSPVQAHWGIPDPAEDGDFDSAYASLHERVSALVSLPVEDLGEKELKAELRSIHEQVASKLPPTE